MWKLIGWILLIAFAIWLLTNPIFWAVIIVVAIGWTILKIHHKSANKSNKKTISSDTSSSFPVKQKQEQTDLKANSTKNTVSKISHSLPKQQHNITPTQELFSKIPDEIVRLMWFYDGPHKNISAEDDEPSAVSLQLPIGFEKPTPLPYWPNYSEMTPDQRGTYLNWLQDISTPVDIGYVFTFFYGIERQILVGNVDTSVDIICKLKQAHDQPSFNEYSDNTLIFAALQRKDPNILQYVNPHTKDLKNLILSKAYFSNKLTPDDIVRISREVGWENQRYIKMYPDIFKKNISDALTDMFGGPFFEIPHNISDVPTSTVYLSNVHLGKNQIEHEESGIKMTINMDTPLSIDVPDFSKAVEIQQPLLQVLMLAHEKTKQEVHELQQKGTNVSSSANKTKQRVINGRTGFPMSTEKSIYAAESQLEMMKESKKYNSNIIDADISYYSGDLYYKKGDWDKAEKSWLGSIHDLPTTSAAKLAIMYRKQNRLQDEIDVLKTGIELEGTNSESPIISNDLEKRLERAEKYYSKHSEKQHKHPNN